MFSGIASAVASTVGNIAGDLLGSAGNFLGSSNLQEDSQSWQRHILQNQKQWQVDDLIKAGLNPVLATGLNPSMPSSGTANWTGASTAGLRESLSSLRRNEKEIAEEQLKTAQAARESASAKALSDRIDADLKKDFWVNMGPEARRIFYGQSIMPGSTAGQVAGIAGQVLSGIENGSSNSAKSIDEKLNSFTNGAKTETIMFNGVPLKLHFPPSSRDKR